jgi:hypothetical protein
MLTARDLAGFPPTEAEQMADHRIVFPLLHRGHPKSRRRRGPRSAFGGEPAWGPGLCGNLRHRHRCGGGVEVAAVPAALDDAAPMRSKVTSCTTSSGPRRTSRRDTTSIAADVIYLSEKIFSPHRICSPSSQKSGERLHNHPNQSGVPGFDTKKP